MRTNSHKGGRINSDVQRVISHVIEFEMKDPRVSRMVSVVKTEVTKDLKECKCYVSILGTPEEEKETMQGLKSAGGFVRKRLAESLNLRNTPEIHFISDHSIAYGVEMSKKIDEVMKPLHEKEETEDARDK